MSFSLALQPAGMAMAHANFNSLAHWMQKRMDAPFGAFITASTWPISRAVLIRWARQL